MDAHPLTVRSVSTKRLSIAEPETATEEAKEKSFAWTVREGTLVARSFRGAKCSLGEKFLIAYFVYTAVLVSMHGALAHRKALAWVIPIALWSLARIESLYSRPWSRVARNLAVLAFIPVAYWQVDWVSFPRMSRWANTWIGWDRFLLDDIGLRGAIEALGPVIPAGLEAIYLLVYAIPPLCVAALYWSGTGSRVHGFLATLFLGTLCAYALLPHFPTVSPRVAFQNDGVPNYSGFFRLTNIWVLNRFDISSSVFPSGHVAVAFCAAFGLLRAVPERRWFWGVMFTTATLVWIATIYCRYHYAADGLASLGISALAWRATGVIDPNE